jgi:quinol monooxygenase YgiN
MTGVWTQGTYTVKPGLEAEFVRAWRELADAAVDGFGVSPPTILRDREEPNVFVTFGSWDSDETIERFRSSPAVRARAAALDRLLARADARTLEVLLP